MGNSTTTLQSVVSYARTFPDLAPIVQVTAGGQSNQPALTICNDVTTEMISQLLNWKWNRFKMPVFYTNGWQSDYALNVVNLGWLEHGFLVDINNTAQPKPIWPLEVVKDLELTSAQFGMPGQVCWLPNDQLMYGTWGAASTGTADMAPSNPGPGVVISTPLGVLTSPQNPWLQVVDAFGNYWAVTGYGTCGASNPFATNLNPVYPTPASPTAVATTVTDGSVTWTAINPKGQGIRCNPLPPQLGVVYQFNLIGQYRPFAFSNGPFTSLSQTIEPIPDDFAKYFRDGFLAYCYLHSEDKGLRAKFKDMYAIWMESLMNSRQKADRERDNAGFYPSNAIMTGGGSSFIYPGPAYPFPIGY